jgi:putative membrane protein
MYGHGFGLGMGLMSLSGLLLVALLVAVGVLLWRAAGPDDDAAARRTLADRFARGEISDEEYRRRLGVLRRSRTER